MGRMQAEVIREEVDLTIAMHWHLQHNHYPPVPVEMVPFCVGIVEGVQNDTLGLDDDVDLPTGVLCQGKVSVVVRNVMEAFHLWDMVKE